METISAKQAVLLVDATAKFYIWSNGPCGWVKGANWETKITNSESEAWGAAVEKIAAFAEAYQVFANGQLIASCKYESDAVQLAELHREHTRQPTSIVAPRPR